MSAREEFEEVRGEDSTRDPSQLIPPHIDTSVEIFGPMTPGDIALLLPAGVVGLLAVVAAFAGSGLVWVALPTAGLLVFAAAGIKLVTGQHTRPRDYVRGWLAYLARWWTLQWSGSESVAADVHGVRTILPDGVAEMQDGRLVGLVHVDPTNTALRSSSERDNLATQLSTVVDEHVNDHDVTLFATTDDRDMADLLGQYEQQVATGVTDLTEDFRTAMYQRELLDDVTAWYRETDAPSWDPGNWEYYVAVSVAPGEITPATRVSRWQLLNPFSDVDHGAITERQAEELYDRLDAVRGALDGIDGLDATQVGVREHVDLLARFWTGTGAVDEDLLESLANGQPTPEQGQRLREQLAPDDVDVTREYVRLGDQYCRTFRVAEWPVEPQSLFLRDLFTLQGVDVDVCLRVRAQDKRRKVAHLERKIADIESEGLARQEDSHVTAADIEQDIDSYLTYRELLRTTRTQPWRLSAYVTVRADTEAAMARAEETLTDYQSPAQAARAVLRDDAETVRKVLESSPADCLAIAPGTRQLEALTACAPTATDELDAVSSGDKTVSVPGGAIGAAFPFCATGIREREGMDWGRNTQNGSMLKADPFGRKSAPHILTMGKSRSGKTYAAKKAAARWYLQSDDHTLVLCDTQGGFDGITKLLGGEHVVIDGSQTINPLDIQPVPDHVRESTGGQIDPYRMKIEEATQFFAGILRSQGIESGPYIATVEEGLEATYADAGIYQGDLDSHARESPTVDDFIDTLGDMLENPADYTHTEHAAEIERKVSRVSDLLDKLSGFKEGGKYDHLETGAGIMDPDIDMAYLDLQQLQDATAAEKSIMLQLMLGQVAQKAKRTEGKLVFMIDEAHVLFHSDQMVRWLQKAAREWARYDAALWFISQSPREFVQQSASRDVGQENERRTIVDQCSTIHFFRTPRVDSETLRQFGLNDQQIEFIRKEATPGKAGRGYSECLTYFEDYEGWFPTHVEAAPFEDLVYNYAAREHGDFDEYVRRHWGRVEESVIVDGEMTVEPNVPLNDPDVLARKMVGDRETEDGDVPDDTPRRGRERDEGGRAARADGDGSDGDADTAADGDEGGSEPVEDVRLFEASDDGAD